MVPGYSGASALEVCLNGYQWLDRMNIVTSYSSLQGVEAIGVISQLQSYIVENWHQTYPVPVWPKADDCREAIDSAPRVCVVYLSA